MVFCSTPVGGKVRMARAPKSTESERPARARRPAQPPQPAEPEHSIEEQLRLAIDYAPVNIAIFNSRMCYLAASKQWQDEHDLAGRQFIGASLYQTAPKIPVRWKEIHRRLLAGDIPSAEEKFLLERNGEIRWQRGEARPWRFESGRIGGIVVISEDITADKQAGDTQGRELGILQAVLHGATNSNLAYLDPDFNFVLVNDAYARTCGYQPDEMKGRNYFALYPNPEYEEVFRRVRDTGEPATCHDSPFEFPDQPGRGITYWDSALIPVKDAAGTVTGLVFSLIETTERKRAEEILQRTKAELEEMVNERTAELSQMVISLQKEVALRKIAEEVLHKRGEQLRELAAELTRTEQRERQRLAQILHDGLQQILVGAKYRLGSVKSGEDANHLASEVVKIIDEAIEISRTLTASLSPPILHQSGLIAGLKWLADRMRREHGLEIELRAFRRLVLPQPELEVFLFQAVRELLFNVLKHAGTPAARVTASRRKGRLRITVEDSGSGFDQTQLRVSGGKTGGFGLFYIGERIGMLGGRMAIDTAPGRGSRITLSVPLPSQQPVIGASPAQGFLFFGKQAGPFFSPYASRRKAANTTRVAIKRRMEPESVPAAAPLQFNSAPVDKTPSSGAKIRVVIVDDHMVMRQGLASLLRAVPDIEILGEAADGESAIRLIQDVHPDVVLMDISMPGMDGIQATRIIHSEHPEVQVIGLSMFQEGEQAAAMREAGAVDYITKSGPSEAVIAAIRSCAAKVLSRTP